MSQELPITILHIDDNETNRYIIGRMLREAGFEAIEAATATIGLQLVTQDQPDLVILDIKLPDISGFEVCQKIKSNPETALIPVLHLSASFVESQDRAKGLNGGADAYLVQPVEAIELIATVKALLRIREAEEAALTSAREWQITFDTIRDGVGLLDSKGNFVRCNKAMTKLLDQPVHELIGNSHQDILHLILNESYMTPFIRAKETLQRESIEIESKNKWYNIIIDPILNQHRVLTGAVFIIVDITERKQIEKEREILYEESQRANRIKDEFLAILSHELRSPLNPILGWASLLKTSKFNADTIKHGLEIIERNANLQTRLIEDLLDVSRILRGKLILNTYPVELPSIIASALEIVQLSAKAKSIEIETKIDANVGAVQADPSRLQQVIWNLLSNAIKFTPSGGKVTIYLERIDKYAQITISDTGKGISKEFLPYVFDYFRQADSTTTRKFGGLGLGLAIVHHLVELHGGTVQAQSAGEGQGASFIVRLPVIAPQSTTYKENKISTQTLSLQGLKVLVVDDEADMRDFLRFALQQYGADVIAVADANQALLALIDKHPDILLSDIGMPGMDGYMFIRQVRKLEPTQGGQIPAIALTAYAGDINEQQALKAGFQKHISKPVEPYILVKEIFNLRS
ncbi:hybrid sensor histidine kinase/response regulator [Gloeothece verrucosa]|uniref:histidine kinase n=1 Tax=Gloeothece verrucosa (strain PCC 7822) TaxID=497965 RepID=E0UGQ7_GLOV7|nr:response regulator [Gloeothece verrucosa]ADN13266.1 PAS/PAC sensor hybrid histidine kinase [Gloeothece verrucosa PCC 7822]